MYAHSYAPVPSLQALSDMSRSPDHSLCLPTVFSCSISLCVPSGRLVISLFSFFLCVRLLLVGWRRTSVCLTFIRVSAGLLVNEMLLRCSVFDCPRWAVDALT